VEYLTIQQAVKHVKKKFKIPEKWKGNHHQTQNKDLLNQKMDAKLPRDYTKKTSSIKKVKVSNSLLGLITNLGDKSVIKTRKTRGTFFYNIDDINKVFSGWEKMRKMKIKVEFKKISTKLREEAMNKIKKRMIMMTDIGITKYQVVEDKLYKYYGKNKVKCSSF
jgi:hypothetical protein